MSEQGPPPIKKDTEEEEPEEGEGEIIEGPGGMTFQRIKGEQAYKINTGLWKENDVVEAIMQASFEMAPKSEKEFYGKEYNPADQITKEDYTLEPYINKKGVEQQPYIADEEEGAEIKIPSGELAHAGIVRGRIVDTIIVRGVGNLIFNTITFRRHRAKNPRDPDEEVLRVLRRAQEILAKKEAVQKEKGGIQREEKDRIRQAKKEEEERQRVARREEQREELKKRLAAAKEARLANKEKQIKENLVLRREERGEEGKQTTVRKEARRAKIARIRAENKYRNRLRDMRRFLLKITPEINTSPGLIFVNQERIKVLSDEKLTALVRKSVAREWEHNPFFYRAVIEELTVRGLA